MHARAQPTWLETQSVVREGPGMSTDSINEPSRAEGEAQRVVAERRLRGDLKQGGNVEPEQRGPGPGPDMIAASASFVHAPALR